MWSILFFFCSLAQADFKFRINEDLGSLDWGKGEVNGAVVQQLMEGLTLSGPRGEPLPALATSWKIVGGRVPSVTFNLRKTATWSDGKPVCAQHFVDAWTRVLSPEFGSPYAHLLFDVEKVSAKGCHTFVVALKHPAAYFPALASHWVLFPIRLDHLDWRNPLVTGPYVLKEWKRDQYYVLERNWRYWGAPAHEERLRAVVVSDDNTALNLFQSGALDWVRDVPFLEKPKLAGRPDYKLYPSLVSYFLGFNMSEGLTRDERCALARAIDKRKIADVLKGGETPAWSIAPSLLEPGSPPHVLFDAAAAKTTWPGKRTQLEAHYYSKDIHAPLMELVQEEWRRNLGVNVELRRTEGKTYWATLQKRAPMVFLSGTTAPYAHPYAFYAEFLSGNPANWGHYSSSAYDAAATRLSALSLDSPALSKTIAEARRTALEKDCAVIPLYFRQTAALVSGDWDGFFVNPMTYVYLKNVRRRAR